MPTALRKEILQDVVPSAKLTRKARASARVLIGRVRALARKRGLTVTPTLVGSLYKGTHLRDPLDIDVFVLFPPATSRDTLEREGIRLGQAVLDRSKLKYAEHPYVHGTHDGFVFDVVPAYRIRTIEGRLSAVDRSPLHARFVRRKLSAAQRDEVRLLKRFLQGIGAYGAETATGGVSGYLAELLILKYGSFPRALDHIRRWNPPVRLALRGRPEDLGGSLVFVDPVDAARNAAAAVQPETLARIVRAAAAFSQRPRRQFFYPNTPSALPPAALARLAQRRSFFGLDVPAPPGREETLLPRSHRLSLKFARALEDAGFRLLRRTVHPLPRNRMLLWWQHAPDQLPPTYEHRGPRADEEAHLQRFLEKWNRHPDAVGAPRLAKGRWVVIVRRKQRTPEELLAARVPRLLEGFDFPPNAIRSARLRSKVQLLAAPAHRLPLTLSLKRLDPWDY